MRLVGEDLVAPTGHVEIAMHEALAQRSSGFRRGIARLAEVISEQSELAAVEFAQPALDRNLPVGVRVEEAADNTDTDRLARRGRRRQRRRREQPRHNAANHAAVQALQIGVIKSLI